MRKLDLFKLFPPCGQKRRPSRRDLSALPLDESIVKQVLFGLGLSYVGDRELATGNVCMANVEEVLPAYRTEVTKQEFIDFVIASWNRGSQAEKEEWNNLISIPSSGDVFWESVGKGQMKK